jgi:aminoglycoside phosphotransferase (APT) family kinase protein
MLCLQKGKSGEEAAELVAAALGVRVSLAERQRAGASGNAVYRLILENGDSVILRASSRANAFAFTRRNLRALAILGLPVQAVLAAGAWGDGGSYVILNWIPGRDLIDEIREMSKVQLTRLAGKVVEFQRRLALLPKSDGFGWAPIGQSGSLRRWTDIFGGKLSPADAEDGTPLGALRARLCRLRGELESYFAEVRPTAFLDDLTTKNILVERGELTGIIDADFVCYGDPLLAVGATLASIAADLPESAASYGHELIQRWNPNAVEHRAIMFYAALWAVGSLRQTDADVRPVRANRLHLAAQCWLSVAERATHAV